MSIAHGRRADARTGGRTLLAWANTSLTIGAAAAPPPLILFMLRAFYRRRYSATFTLSSMRFINIFVLLLFFAAPFLEISFILPPER